MTKCRCEDCVGPLDRRQEIRHGGVTEEELPRGPKRKKNKRWCKGKEGREHRWQEVLWYTYRYKDSFGNEKTAEKYRWGCAGCGKIEWSEPKPEVGKHDHHYCITKISQRWKREEIYEQCCVCGGKGRSYSFYRER